MGIHWFVKLIQLKTKSVGVHIAPIRAVGLEWRLMDMTALEEKVVNKVTVVCGDYLASYMCESMKQGIDINTAYALGMALLCSLVEEGRIILVERDR